MWTIPLFATAFDDGELEAVRDVVRGGWLTMGEISREFERRFAEFIGVRHAVAVSSCTAALHIANLVLGIGPGDEVICPSMTFVAAANSIMYTGARPVFADIESLDDFSISPGDVEAKITPNTRAIQVAHYAGYPVDMDGIKDIARRHGVYVVEDCAHAPGAVYGDRKCGGIGDIGCFSFFSNKNLTTGEGGMLTTDDDNLAEKMRLLRSHGMTSVTLDRHEGRAVSYDVVDLGYNYRIDEIRSALGLVQLRKLAANNARRAQINEWYRERLAPVSGIALPYSHCARHAGSSARTSVHHIFPVVLDEGVRREEFMARMKARGIQTSIHYPPIHLFSSYRERFGYEAVRLPVTETASRREVTLPLYPTMTEEDVDYVCRSAAAAPAGG